MLSNEHDDHKMEDLETAYDIYSKKTKEEFNRGSVNLYLFLHT